jgi:hypothetical protein
MPLQGFIYPLPAFRRRPDPVAESVRKTADRCDEIDVLLVNQSEIVRLMPFGQRSLEYSVRTKGRMEPDDAVGMFAWSSLISHAQSAT